MSKLSFRARALDPSKQMPIYLAEELPDLPEYSAINRAVPQMPSGMEKEEESEHHLQRAICTGLIIPTPEVFTTDQEFYDKSYPANYKMPRQMIHMQPLGLEQDIPDYDMDSSDEIWVNQQTRRLDLTPLKFEQMMDRLEKSSGQTVVTLNEAKALLKQDDEISIAVYDYWLNKRLKMQHPLILSVKTENRPGTSSNNPYLAFRRRTEKMQTRKNRKNDETSYEKMLKLRRDLQRATTVLEMVKRREKTKREQLHLSIEIFEKRVQLRDFSGAVISELSSTLKNSRPAFAPLYTNQYSHHSSSSATTPTGVTPTGAGVGGVLAPGLLSAGSNNANTNSGHLYSSTSQYLNSSSLAIDAINASGNGSRKEKRQYKKRKHKLPRDKQLQQQQQYLTGVGPPNAAAVAAAAAAAASTVGGTHHPHLQHLHPQSSSPAAIESNLDSEEEDYANSNQQNNGSEGEEEAPFTFRRRQQCDYQRPLATDGNWPWETQEDNDFVNTKYRFTLTSIRHPRPRCIGFARRRLGRGGRVILDRASTSLDDFWSQLDYTIFESRPKSEMKSIKKELQLPTTMPSLSKPAVKSPASPPTVVDLPSIVGLTPTAAAAIATTIAMPTIKIEVDDYKDSGDVSATEKAAAAGTTTEDEGVEGDFDVDNSEDDFDDQADIDDDEDENISRDGCYISAVTLECLQRLRRRRRRRLKQMKNKFTQNECPTTKRRKFNHANVIRSSVGEVSNESAAEAITPLSRLFLQRLAKTIESNSINNISNYLLGEKVKREKLNGDEVSKETANGASAANELVETKSNALQQELAHEPINRSTPNILKNNNSSSNINVINNNNNNNINVSDKFNVIKNETEMVTIKQEAIDAADDSNEPLISMQKSTNMSNTAAEILDDEDNVNLARLSSLINANRQTIKKEPFDVITTAPKMESADMKSARSFNDNEDNFCTTPLNQVEDVIRLENIRNKKNEAKASTWHDGSNVNVLIDYMEESGTSQYLGGLSPTSSQRLDVCNELLSEIRRDWLHFRPKTPSDELSDGISDSWDKLPSHLLDGDSPIVDWSEQTPISVELQKLRPLDEKRAAAKSLQPPKQKITSLTNLWDTNNDDALFVTTNFAYTDLEPDTQLLQNVFAPDVARGSSKSPEAAGGNSNSGIDFNLSGDSLNDINLLGDGDENDENMLDNILQECQIDDLKTLNQTTNFWNGILDGAVDGEAVDDVGGDVEAVAGLLDCIDDKKTSKEGTKRSNMNKAKMGKRIANSTFGCSNFSNTSSGINGLRDGLFFKKDEPNSESDVKGVSSDAVKIEPSEEALPPLSTQPTTSAAAAKAQHGLPTTVLHSNAILATQMIQQQSMSNLPQYVTSKPQQQLLQPLTQQHQQQQQHSLQQAQLLHQHQQQQQHEISNVAAAVGDIITVTTQQPHQQIVQIQQQQQPLRNVAVQQLHQLQQQQLLQQQQQRQQQQLLLQMQRDLVSTPVITQYINTSSTSAPVMRQQPTLTPIGSSASGNHMIYTTTSADGIPGTQKIYIQKATTAANAATNSNNQQQQITVGGATQVPSSLNTNAVITLSNVKLDNDGNQSTPGGANILTIDSSGAVGGSSTSSGQNVNIINTASGQQLAVHSIGNVQHGAAAQLTSGTSTPLIVTTSARNSQHMQQQQQQLVHPQQQTQQIVWRQIGSTNLGSATGVLTTSSEAAAAAMAGGNKIVWASRPGQKRQINGPDGTDINKLLLNRKFSQRKIISQQPQQQHQIQITKQHLQQLQQQQLQQQQLQQQQQQQQGLQIQDDEVNNTIHEGQQHHHHQQQQLQKVQMQSGKVIKMSSFPLLVSELNMSQQTQQQQQQQKQNSAAIAANHNYSLQPTAIITSQTNQQQQQMNTSGGNKVILTNTGGGAGIAGGGGTNFTIATAAELQQQQLQNTQKIHYKDLQNSNLKVNFVSTSGGIQQGNIVVEAKTVVAAASQQQQGHQQQQQQTVVLNKAAPNSLQQQQLLQQQQKLKRERILNIIGATSAAGGGTVSVEGAGTTTVNVSSGAALTADNAGNKRVLYTSLLNVKPLQKNNAGQMQMQLAPGGLTHAVLRGRIGNNQTIFTNMRSVPIASVANSQVMTAVTATAATSNSNTAVATTITNNTTQVDASISTIVGEAKSIESVTVNNNNNGSVGALVANNSNSNSNSNSATGSNNNSNPTVANAVNSNNATIASATINR